MGNVIYTPNTKDAVDGSRVGNKNAADLRTHSHVQSIASDAAEAGSTVQYIIATAHVARKGDLIRFTSGALNQVEVSVLSVIDANIIKVETLDSAPAAADTFDILRWRQPLVGSSGGAISTSITSFNLDGAVVEVNEDTVTPANNVPLPVKLISASGDVTITADNLDVQLTHTGASPDSVQIGDGTNVLSMAVEDSAAASGNIGIAAMAVRNSAGAVLTDADGDYSNITVDDTGRLRVDATITEAATAADGAAGLPAVSKVVAGYDGANVRTLHTDAAGDLQVDIASALPAGTNNIGDVDVLTEPATSADAAAGLPAVSKVVAGYDGSNVRTMHVDATGDVQVDLASALPSGTNNIGDVDVLSLPGGLTGYAEDSAHISGDIGVMPLAVRNDAGTTLADTDGDYAPISLDSSGNVRIAGTVSTSEQAVSADGAAGLPAVSKVVAGYDGANVRTMHVDAAGDVQVDLASSLPAGTNNIGDVDVLSLPGGLTGYTEDTAHTTGDFGIMPFAVRRDADTSLVDTDGDYAPLQVDANGALKVSGTIGVTASGKTVVTTVRNDYTSTSVTTGAWVQLVASLGATVTELEIFDSSGETLELGTGAAASETRLILIVPGGNGRVPVSIASGTRLSIRAVSSNASVGELDINIYGA